MRRSINFMTYNTQLFPTPLNWFVYLDPAPRIAALPTVLKDKIARNRLDILAFQEAFSRTSWKMLAKTADELGYFITPKTPKRWRTPVSAGIAIMSRTELSNHHFQSFSTSSGSDRLSNKGFIYVDTIVRNGSDSYKIGIIATHLQADDSWSASLSGRSVKAASQHVRDQQLREIQQYIHENVVADSLDSLILMGDLNLDGLDQATKTSFQWSKVEKAFAIVGAQRPVFDYRGCTDDSDALVDHSMNVETNNYLQRLFPSFRKDDTNPDLHAQLDYVVPIELPERSTQPPPITFQIEHVRYTGSEGDLLDLSDHHAGIARLPFRALRRRSPAMEAA